MKDNKYIDKTKSIVNKFWHIGAVILISIFSVYTSLQGYKNLITDSELTFLGNDSWYHFRATMYQVVNYPSFIEFDPMTGYPGRNQPGTFGTLYDFIHATIAQIIGLGDPSVDLVREILIVSSPVMSGIAIITVYILTKYITDSKKAGVLASGILSLIPGTFYVRSRAGFANHHMLEVILFILSLYTIVKAIEYSSKNNIIYGVIKNEYKSDVVKGWFKWVGLASISVLLYYMTWPPAIMIIGLLGGTGLIYVLVAHSRDIIIESELLTISVLSGINLLIILLNRPELSLDMGGLAKPSIVHVGVGVLAVFMSSISYYINKRANEYNWDSGKFYGVLLGILLAPTLVVGLIEPLVFNRILDAIFRLLGYPFGLGGGDSALTIAEERPSSIYELTISQYGLLLTVTIGSFGLLIKDMYSSISSKKGFCNLVFLVIVGIFITAISIRTIRFNYYLASIVATFSAYFIYEISIYADLSTDLIYDLSKIKGYHIVAIFIICLMLFPVLLVPVNTPAVYDQSVREDPTYSEWQEPLQWLDENGKETNIESYGEYGPSDEYKYPDEAYGVMSWWDYGHWITVTGDKPAIANPFQANAISASEFLLSSSPEQADEKINELKDYSDLQNEDETKAKYVILDWQTVEPLSKMSALPQFNDEVNNSDLYSVYYQSTPSGQPVTAFTDRKQRYYESMMVRLYYGHGSYMDASKYTINYETRQTQSGQQIKQITPELNPIKKHNTTEEAIEYSQNNTEVSHGGIGRFPSEPVEALDQYRLVKSSSASMFDNLQTVRVARNIDNNIEGNLTLTDINRNPASVKIFEKVDGSDVTISGISSNSEIKVEVTLGDPATRQRFDYTQYTDVDSNGSAQLTVPYSTTGYDNVDKSPEVRSLGPYKIYNENGEQIGSFNVSESNVINDEEPVDVSV